MICPKCGTENKGNFCIKCGAIVKDNTLYQINTKQVSTNTLLETYFGLDYNKIVMKPANIFGGIFGPLYLVYRNCFIGGFILLFIQIGLGFLLLPIIATILPVMKPISTYLIFAIIIFFLQGSLANPMIINHAKRKINKLRKKYGPNREIIAKAGEPNFALVIIFILLVVLIGMLAFYFYNTY